MIALPHNVLLETTFEKLRERPPLGKNFPGTGRHRRINTISILKIPLKVAEKWNPSLSCKLKQLAIDLRTCSYVKLKITFFHREITNAVNISKWKWRRMDGGGSETTETVLMQKTHTNGVGNLVAFIATFKANEPVAQWLLVQKCNIVLPHLHENYAKGLSIGNGRTIASVRAVGKHSGR